MSSVIAPESTGAYIADYIDGSGLDIQGSEGEDNLIKVMGDADVDLALAGESNDTIDMGAGDDKIFAGPGDDAVMGGNGNDILRGGTGDDMIHGELGDDTIIGGADNDVIRGGMGSDLLKGSDGDDVFEFAAQEFVGGAMDEIVDFQDGGFDDVIKIFGAADTVEYDAASGMVSVDGTDAIKLAKNLDIEATQNENDTWELF